MSISPIFGTIASGLRYESTRLAVSANNVANVLTPGFTPSQAVAVQAPGGGVTTSVQPVLSFPPQAFSGVDLVAETVTQSSAIAAYKAQVAALRSADQTFQSLMDIRR